MAQAVMIGAMIASTAVSVVGGLQTAAAQEAQGKAAQQAANAQAAYTRNLAASNAARTRTEAAYNAARQREQANVEAAKGQRTALETKRQTDLMLSASLAKQAAYGGGADPTSIALYKDIEQIGMLNTLNDLFAGDSSASLLRDQAALTLYTGESKAQNDLYTANAQADTMVYEGAVARSQAKAAANASRLGAVGSLVGGVSSIAGAGGFNSYSGPQYTNTSAGRITWNTDRKGVAYG